MTLSEKILMLRKQKGWSQEELAGEARSIPAVCVEMGEWKQSSGSEPDSGSVAVVRGHNRFSFEG